MHLILQLPGAGVSYLVWGDNGGTVTPAITTDLPASVGACASRLAREWKMKRTGTGITTTEVKMDLNSTAASTASLADLFLMVDRDGDGNFTTGTIFGYPATGLSAGIATFSGVTWDVDNNDSDVFALIINSSTYSFPPSLVASGSSTVAPSPTCADNNGYKQFVDVIGASAQKLAAINTNTYTTHSFSVRASNDSGLVVANQMKTDGVNTSALMNRMLTVTDAGANNYPLGMTVRFYYSAADSTAAVSALGTPGPSDTVSFRWFKVAGNSTFAENYPGSVSTVLAAQTSDGEGMSNWGAYGVTLLTPARYGTEGGVKYVEFDNITSFSTFGALAKLGAGPVILPVDFTSFAAVSNNCSVTLNWKYNESEKASSFFIERSNNGSVFDAVASLNGTETAYVDVTPSDGKWLYRIKAVKPDQKVVYTNTIAVSTTNCAENTVSVYPNPAHSELNIVLNGQNSESRFELIDMIGKVVLKGSLIDNAANKIDITHYARGAYLLRVVTGMESKTYQLQLVK